MKELWAYLRLIRITNLIIIVLSQYFFRLFIILPLYSFENITPPLSGTLFFMLVLSTVFIAAGAYAINDYFDMRIDRINKPHKMVLGRIIPRRMAILIHGIFTGLGILLSLAVAYSIGAWKLGLISVIIAFTLWMYSFKYKASFLSGNVIIALLSAFVFFTIWLFDFYAQINSGMALINGRKFFHGFMLTYAFFAFVTSLIREIIKDIEDIEGDKKVGCRTLPVVWGIKNAKILSMALAVLNIGFIVFVFITLQNFNLFYLLKYYLVLIAFLFFYLIYVIRKADKKEDFSFISMFSKVIMFAGLLSMQLIYTHF